MAMESNVRVRKSVVWVGWGQLQGVIVSDVFLSGGVVPESRRLV